MRISEFAKKTGEFNDRLVDEACRRSKLQVISMSMDFVVSEEIVAIAEMATVRGFLDPKYEPARVELQDTIRTVKAKDFTYRVYKFMIDLLEEPDDDGSYEVFYTGRRYNAVRKALMEATKGTGEGKDA